MLKQVSFLISVSPLNKRAAAWSAAGCGGTCVAARVAPSPSTRG